MAPGTGIDLNLQSPGGGLSFRLSAEVTRRVSKGEIQSLGVRFVEMSADQAQNLESLVSRLIEGSTSGPLAELAPSADPALIRATLAEMPLAHRMTLATRAGLVERKLLFHDAHPQVLTALVRNPHIRFEEIVALVVRPTLVAPTLQAIARDPRWRSKEDLHVRLASHPGVTLQVAEQIAASLSRPARDRLLRRPGLKEPLRQKLLRR